MTEGMEEVRDQAEFIHSQFLSLSVRQSSEGLISKALPPDPALLEEKVYHEVWRDTHIQTKEQPYKSCWPATLRKQTEQTALFVRDCPPDMSNLRYNPLNNNRFISPCSVSFSSVQWSIPLNQSESFLETSISRQGR